MNFAIVNKKALEIRKIASLRFSCPVLEILWKGCGCLELAQFAIQTETNILNNRGKE